jgi:2-polyprenyl-3-methyl-5-hydroxy-6-metoxy-1,4-benzoquinol methylase
MSLGPEAAARSDEVDATEHELPGGRRSQAFAVEADLCLICNGASHRRFQRHGYWIRECEYCGHRFAEIGELAGHVARTYADRYFYGDPAGYPNYLDEGELLVAHGRRYGRLVNQYMEPGSLLEVGAAAGLAMKGFMDQGWRAVGVEPNARMAEHARSRLGLEVETCTLEDYEPTERFDLVSMIQVVPHFVDPRRALRCAAQMTRPGGFWLIETWDRRSRMARLMGARWHEYSPPSVLHWFSRGGLSRLVGEIGFSEVASGHPQKWIKASHAKAVVGASIGAGALSKLLATMVTSIPDQLALPYIGDDLYWVLYRRSSRGSSVTQSPRGLMR